MLIGSRCKVLLVLLSALIKEGLVHLREYLQGIVDQTMDGPVVTHTHTSQLPTTAKYDA